MEFMTLNDDKFGPIQLQWLQNMERYPERQERNSLGSLTSYGYVACCLGELKLTAGRARGLSLLDMFDKASDGGDDLINVLIDGQGADGDSELLADSYKEFGLNDKYGTFICPLSGREKYLTIDGKTLKEYEDDRFADEDEDFFEEPSVYDCLSEMNDQGVTWPEIAKFVRKHPELVFYKKV